jgi:hypothetical protein
MPVWVEGQTGKGYKREQFADAFHRVLGVRGVRTVRSGMAPDAAPNSPNPPNPPNPLDAGEEETSRFCEECTTQVVCAARLVCAEIERLAAEAAANGDGR